MGPYPLLRTWMCRLIVDNGHTTLNEAIILSDGYYLNFRGLQASFQDVSLASLIIPPYVATDHVGSPSPVIAVHWLKIIY